MRHVRTFFVIVAALSFAVAVNPSSAGAATPSNRYGIHEYVAIGDSYSAGYGIPWTAYAGGCRRSNHSYPVIVYKVLGSDRARDVTCTGATPADTTRPQVRTTASPQFSALDARTDLVTVGLGANQGHLFAYLVEGCPSLRHFQPDGHPCESAARRSGTDVFYALADQAAAAVRDVLAGVRNRAPHAEVIVVGYPRLAPGSGTCAALPLAPGDYAYVNSVIHRLDRNLATVARRAGDRYVDLWGPSAGHDICSSSPWVQGSVDTNGLAAAYHPFYVEQRFVAMRVLAIVAHSHRARRGPVRTPARPSGPRVSGARP